MSDAELNARFNSLRIYDEPQQQMLYGVPLYSRFDLSRIQEICAVAGEMGLIIAPAGSWSYGFDIDVMLAHDEHMMYIGSLAGGRRGIAMKQDVRLPRGACCESADMMCLAIAELSLRLRVRRGLSTANLCIKYNRFGSIDAHIAAIRFGGPKVTATVNRAASHVEEEVPQMVERWSRLPSALCGVVMLYLQPPQVDFFERVLELTKQRLE